MPREHADPGLRGRELSNFSTSVSQLETLSLLIVTAGFIGLLWLTQSLIRRGMDDGSTG